MKYVCCSCPLGFRGNFCKQQYAIILQYTDISESMLLEFCGTYFGTNRGGLGAMFAASVPDDFFEDGDEESFSVMESCNIFITIKEDKEEEEDGLRIS